jgi:uncharacterized Fe-S cluster-containing radical SAM superfamily protein
MNYIQYVTPKLKPFNPLKLARETERIVVKNNQRKYTAFYCTGVYGGISTGYVVGCCLRCVFCWVDLSRDFPEQFGRFYSPKQAFKNLVKNAKKAGVGRLRISGGEPTLGREHLISLLKLVDKTNLLFILETNGILFGKDESYVEELRQFKNIHVRLSFKAGTSEGFQQRTGAIGRFFELPFQAARNLLKHKISFHAAAMSDPRMMPMEERGELIKKLEEIAPWLARNLEEERMDPYPHTLFRLEKAGYDVKELYSTS